jgi:hypothetical protein
VVGISDVVGIGIHQLRTLWRQAVVTHLGGPVVGRRGGLGRAEQSVALAVHVRVIMLMRRFVAFASGRADWRQRAGRMLAGFTARIVESLIDTVIVAVVGRRIASGFRPVGRFPPAAAAAPVAHRTGRRILTGRALRSGLLAHVIHPAGWDSVEQSQFSSLVLLLHGSEKKGPQIRHQYKITNGFVNRPRSR